MYCAVRLVYTDAHVCGFRTRMDSPEFPRCRRQLIGALEKRVFRMGTIIQLLIALGILKINPTPDSLVPPVKPPTQ